MVIRVLGILCVGVAYQSNKSTQLEITNAEAFVTLVHLLRTFSVPLIQVGFFTYLFNFFGFFYLFWIPLCYLFSRILIYAGEKKRKHLGPLLKRSPCYTFFRLNRG